MIGKYFWLKYTKKLNSKHAEIEMIEFAPRAQFKDLYLANYWIKPNVIEMILKTLSINYGYFQSSILLSLSKFLILFD